MSYDFRLFLRLPGEEPLVTARRDSNDLSNTPLDPIKEAHKRRFSDALMHLNPSLKPFTLRYDEIAKFEEITVAQARQRYRHIELNSPEDGKGIQVTVFDDEASITVPYWHSGQAAIHVFREIWSYLQVFEQEAGYLVYDP